MTKTQKNNWSCSADPGGSPGDPTRRAHQGRWVRHLFVAASIFSASTASASSMVTGIVPVSGRYLVSGAPVMASTSGLLKLTFENNTAGSNLELCAGTVADFNAGVCALRLSDSGGPGFAFLTLVDVSQLSGKIIFVLRAVGLAPSKFTLTVE